MIEQYLESIEQHFVTEVHLWQGVSNNLWLMGSALSDMLNSAIILCGCARIYKSKTRVRANFLLKSGKYRHKT